METNSHDEGLRIFDSPQCLLRTDNGGNLMIEEDIARQISTLDKPLVVVAIAGTYRTGKSYLMNRLAGKSSGFALGSAIEAQTKGIWIWVKPHPIDSSKYLLLMDTEGMGDAFKGNSTHDTWIFCLATLLSSVLVYNGMSAINDDMLKHLQFISEMSNHIRTKQNSRRNNDGDFDWYFPDFVIALRDFSLELVVNGREISEDEYLELCLNLKPGKDEEVKRFNMTRACIRRYFKSRKCFTFDRPAGRKQLKQIDKLKDSDISRDFVADSDRFCEYTYKNAPVKKLENGQPLNGSMWIALVKSYAESIRRGDVPCIENAIVSMATLENGKAMNAGVELYREKMLETVTMPTPDDKTLSKQHALVLRQAIKLFLSKAVCDTNNKYQGRLNDLISIEYECLVRSNHEASKARCWELLTRLDQTMKQKLQEGHYSCPGGYSVYTTDLQDIQKQYTATQGLGVKAHEVLLEYVSKRLEEGNGIMAADKELTEKEKQTEIEKQRALEAEHKRELATKEVLLLQQQAEEREKAIIENIKQLEEKHEVEMREFQRHQDEVMDSRLIEQRRLLEEGFKREADRLNDMIEELKNRPPPRPPGGGGKCTIL